MFSVHFWQSPIPVIALSKSGKVGLDLQQLPKPIKKHFLQYFEGFHQIFTGLKATL
jgi:hypothetical protein